MSEPKLISPMLDNFIMGDPISDHHGVRCCPAMEKGTDNKYIVKIISIPASRTQLDALLLTGAYPDEESANVYFKELADGVCKEIEVLRQLAGQEGFISYENYQVVPMEDMAGFDIYVLCPYKRTLERQFAKKPLTHLDALNLGLDICAALAASRRAGYLYNDLKPGNIYILPSGEYKIGDIGFTKLSSLKYASLPERCLGPYMPPEISDAFSSLNDTLDTYALGMILYQIYNGGQLPELSGNSSDDPPAPEYADPDLSQIILKACHSDASQRWEDPAQMGQALVSYMQRFGASDEPIVPPPPVEPDEPEVPEEQPEKDEAKAADETEAVEEPSEEPIDPVIPAIVEAPADPMEENAEVPPAQEISEDPILAEAASYEDTAEITEDISYDEVSEEVSQILAQADELAAMDVPEPVVAPEAIEVPIPAPIIPVETSQSDEASETAEAESDSLSDTALDETPNDAEESKYIEEPEKAEVIDEPEEDEEFEEKPRSHWLRNTLIVLLLLAVAAAGYLFYRFYYLQNIDDLTVTGSKDTLNVTITSDIDSSLLTVVCTDIYGKSVEVPVVNGAAEFSGLMADTEYTVSVNISGFHKLTGKTTVSYFTPNKTNILSFSSVTDKTPGSVVFTFALDGPDSERWTITYSAEDEDPRTIIFSGHTKAITGLTVGKEYTAVLAPEADLYVSGQQELTFVASDVIQAEDLMITGCADGKLSVQWTAPADTEVDGWIVHCTNGDDYDMTVTVTETSAVFEGLDSADSFTVDVKAVGQSVSQQTSIGANSITVSDIQADTTTAGVLSLTWNATDIPEGGWIVTYTVAGMAEPQQITCTNNSLKITPAVPELEYTFTIQAADSRPVIADSFTCTMPQAQTFYRNYSGLVSKASNMKFQMCKTPAKADWTRKDVASSDYKTSFAIGEKASFVVKLNAKYGISYEEIIIAYVVRDSENNIISINGETTAWSNMWYDGYGTFDIPEMPSEAGDYTIAIYFSGEFVKKISFTITE